MGLVATVISHQESLSLCFTLHLHAATGFPVRTPSGDFPLEAGQRVSGHVERAAFGIWIDFDAIDEGANEPPGFERCRTFCKDRVDPAAPPWPSCLIPSLVFSQPPLR